MLNNMFNILTYLQHAEYKVQISLALYRMPYGSAFNIVSTLDMEEICEKIVHSSKNWKAVVLEENEDTVKILKTIVDEIHQSTPVVIFQKKHLHFLERIEGRLIHRVSRDLNVTELGKILVGEENIIE